MRKLSFSLILLAVLALCSCNKSENLPETNESEVGVSFVAEPEVYVGDKTRAATDVATLDAGKFIFYAFKKDAQGELFHFEKCIKDVTTGKYEGDLWSSSTSRLSVGTYRFLCFYNVGSTLEFPTDETLKSLGSTSWDALKKAMVLTHKVADTDVDEFFCEENKDGSEVQIMGIPGNSVVVKFNELRRVTARIDVKFVKLTADKTQEITYSGTNTIFGTSDNLKGITLGVEGLAKQYSIGKEVNNTQWGTAQSFAYANDKINKLVTIGESHAKSTFPHTSGTDLDMDDTDAMKKGIVKGGAYFRGAYVLPFADETELTKVLITLSDKMNPAARNITATAKLKVSRNYVTLITVSLLSNRQPGGGSGGVVEGTGEDDQEHLFNPNVPFEVTINKLFAGIHNSDVEVD